MIYFTEDDHRHRIYGCRYELPRRRKSGNGGECNLPGRRERVLLLIGEAMRGSCRGGRFFFLGGGDQSLPQ